MGFLFRRRANRTDILSWALVISLVLILLLSFGYILIHTSHQCTGEHCPICERIALCSNSMLHLLGEWISFGLVSFILVCAVSQKLPKNTHDMSQATPVWQHIRMNR